MEFSAEQIALWLDGEIIGDPKATVIKLNKIEEGEPKGLSFLSNPKYNHFLYETKASVVIVNKSFNPEKAFSATIIKVDDSYAAFAIVLQAYEDARKHKKQGVSKLAFVHETAKLGKGVYVGEFVYIGENVTIGDNSRLYSQSYVGDNVKIGEGTELHPGAKIMHECIIGNNCTIHAGAVIGADGFGFAPQKENDYKKVPQIGNVVLGDWVDIGANATVDRATMGSTIIRRGVKLDNMVQIAHNVEVGENTVMASMTGVSGSTKIGKNCMFGGQIGIAGHLEIADGVKLAAQTGVAANIKTEGSVLMGSPAFSHKSFLQSYVHFRKLPKTIAVISSLEKTVKELENKLEQISK
ncbi:MAG: UDP-3-O-(3-hydroxymyristoyl)glucosamine N-acyltransferase [Bacteroidetes bacterium]|nr:MAG: UDP-3-O-(3-hydroxymyristoyl)glucosamine N-acyltransferase [Bacteroidota bacterium]